MSTDCQKYPTRVVHFCAYPYKKCDFGGESMANDLRMHGECEQSLKISANVRRVFPEKMPLVTIIVKYSTKKNYVGSIAKLPPELFCHFCMMIRL